MAEMTKKEAEEILRAEVSVVGLLPKEEARGFLEALDRVRPIIQALEKVHSLEFADDGYFPVNTAMFRIEEALSLWKEIEGDGK